MKSIPIIFVIFVSSWCRLASAQTPDPRAQNLWDAIKLHGQHYEREIKHSPRALYCPQCAAVGLQSRIVVENYPFRSSDESGCRCRCIRELRCERGHTICESDFRDGHKTWRVYKTLEAKR